MQYLKALARLCCMFYGQKTVYQSTIITANVTWAQLDQCMHCVIMYAEVLCYLCHEHDKP